MRFPELYASSDWLVVLFVSVVIGESNHFGFDFTTLNLKLLYGGKTGM